MGKRDPRIDAYIARSAPFARPILTHVRAVVHEACPDVEEAMKWSFPNFLYKGMFCSMAAFKEHCSFGFWKGELVFGGKGLHSGSSMGNFGRLRAVSDLPSKKVLAGYIETAMKLNDEGVRPPWLEKRNAKKAAKATGTGRPAKPLAVPADLTKALKKDAKARTTFDKFPPSHRREYVEWITGAKRAETRARRVEAAVAWMAEGKPQNWRYAK
ncbi:MAG: YdeI/OmpD-associated family protein [Gemmatimonadales bacterium]|jgi:hypothetical protein